MMYIAKISISVSPPGILEAYSGLAYVVNMSGQGGSDGGSGQGGGGSGSGGGGHAKSGCFVLERIESENIDNFSNADEFLTLDMSGTLKGCVDKIFEKGSPW